MSYSPYAPPAHDQRPQAPGYGYGPGYYNGAFPYEPLGWKTTASIVGMILIVVIGIAVTLLTWAVGAENFASDLRLAGAVGLLGLLLSGVSLFTYVVFLVWTHTAAKNIRSFGHDGFEFTPGWAVGWWFIPVMNWFKPFQALREIWQASDPDAIGGGYGSWRGSAVPGTFGVWWGTYLLAGVVGIIGAFVGLGTPGGSPGFAMAAHLLRAFAAVAIVSLMRQLAQRQEAAHGKLRAMHEQPPPPAAYGGYGSGPPGYGPPGY
jgi:hypothetical protein